MSDKELKNNDSTLTQKSAESTPEVFYVPFDRFEEALKPDHFTFDFLAVFKKIWMGKSTISIYLAAFGFVGLFIALFSTVQYQSYALLIPEIGSAPQSRTEQLLQRYGSELGIGNSLGFQEGVLPPMLFPTIVTSTPFQMELLDTELNFTELGKKVTYRDYVENHSKPSPVDYVKKYTLGLPKLLIVNVKRIFTKEKEEESLSFSQSDIENGDVPILRLSKKQQELVDGLRSRIITEQNIENGLIYSAVTMPDPVAAAEMNFAVVELLKQYITDYQLQKVREDLEFTTRMKAESEVRFNEAQRELADFLDRNKVLSTSSARMELERLQDEKSLAFGIYNSVSQRVEQTKLAMNEQRPTFKEVQPVTVPVKHTTPKRMRTVASFLILGFMIGVVWVLSREKIFRAINQGFE